MLRRKPSAATTQRKRELDLLNAQLRTGEAVALGRGTTKQQRQNYVKATRHIPFIANNLEQAATYVADVEDARRQFDIEQQLRADDLAFRHELHRRNVYAHRETVHRRKRREARDAYEAQLRAEPPARPSREGFLYGARHDERVPRPRSKSRSRSRSPKNRTKKASPRRSPIYESPGSTDVEMSDEDAERARRERRAVPQPAVAMIDLTLDSDSDK